MFSSNSNINSLANLSPSYHQFAPVFSGYENNEILLHHQHDPLTGLLLPANPRIPDSLTNMAFTGNNTTMIKQDFNSRNAEYYGAASKFVPRKKPVKKDRHSKIYTARGLRDRRVRLSIEISQEFFALQDMLGFEKASKTLGWLLNKARNAIRELVEMKNAGNIGSAEREDGYENGDSEGTDSRSKRLESRKAAVQILAKEARDKARARARERTREKMCTKLNLQKCKKVADTCPQILTEFRSLSQFKACEASTSIAHNFASSFNVVAEVKGQPCSQEPANQAPMEGVPEQVSNFNMLKRKQNPSSILAYQQNLEISSCNISNNNCNLPQNWDMINSGMPQFSSFRTVTTNMNLSTGKLPE